jgi:3-methyl-2-oxobutanoate hydroxymethyltransferase
MSRREKLAVLDIQGMAERGEKIAMSVCYDALFARFLDEAGVDMILVGDSLGVFFMGLDSPLPVTMDEMIHHAKALSRGAKRALLVGDMPFMSYQTSKQDAIANAGRFLKEAGMDAIKLEGGAEMVETVKAIVDAGIPVMAEIGLLLQIPSKRGSQLQDELRKTADAVIRMLENAEALEQAGCFSLMFNRVPDRLAKLITDTVSIPTIGYGSGSGCDGYIQGAHDLLGMFGPENRVETVTRYANLYAEITQAFAQFRRDVRSDAFPTPEIVNATVDDEVWAEVEARVLQ